MCMVSDSSVYSGHGFAVVMCSLVMFILFGGLSEYL